MLYAAGKPFFTTLGGTATFLVVVSTAIALVFGGFRMMRVLNRIADTPDEVKQVKDSVDALRDDLTRYQSANEQWHTDHVQNLHQPMNVRRR